MNGEAIYGTRAFIKSKKDEQINPETNKSIFFTQKNNDFYIICLNWPKNDIVLKGIDETHYVKAVLLGSGKKVSLRKSGGVLHITAPVLSPDDNQLAYVFKISGLIE